MQTMSFTSPMGILLNFFLTYQFPHVHFFMRSKYRNLVSLPKIVYWLYVFYFILFF